MRNITYINAGAGSGKTHTLTSILTKKLAERDAAGKYCITPSSVILTTFTELAATEFREKARQQLLAGNEQEGIEGNIEAATQLDSAAIGTVHSVALQFIKKFWYLLDYGADIRIISDRDADFYMSQSLVRIVKKYRNDLDNFRSFRNYFNICGKSYDHPDYLFWQRYLRDVVEKMEYYKVDEVEESIQKSLLTLKSVFLPVSASDLDVLEPFVRSIFQVAKAWRDDYIEYKKRNHIISYNDMENLFLRLIETEKEVQSYIHDRYKLVMVDEFQDSNPVQLKIFNRLSELIAPEGQSYWVGDPKQAIYGFRGADTELVNSVSKHFKFYNDDQLHPGTDERNLGSGRLTENWRSCATLVNFVNDCFREAFEKDGLDPLCITLNPHPFKNEEMKQDALTHWSFNVTNKPNLNEAIARKVKELLQSKIPVHRGKRDGSLTCISPRDIAILCRKNNTCKAVAKALRKSGVPTTEMGDSFMQRAEIQLVITLLQFVQNPQNKHTIADLMRLLWGVKTKEILRQRIDYLKKNQKDEWMKKDPRVESLEKKVSRLKSLAVPDLVEALTYICDLPALVARWGDVPARRQNLSSLQKLAEDYDQMCLQLGLGSSINGFIYYLNTIEPDAEKDNMSDTVKVFTYHGSKGLEWPVVIMHELDNDGLEDNDFAKKHFAGVREVISEDRATQDNPFDKSYYLHLFPYTLPLSKESNKKYHSSTLKRIMEQDLYKQLKQRSEKEERRLLYVGMTRAKDCLYTISYKGRGNCVKNAWLRNAGLPGATKEVFWGNLQNSFTIENIEPAGDKDTEQSSPETYSVPVKPGSHKKRGERYLAPSALKDYAGEYSAHQRFGKAGIDIPTKGWNKADYAKIGTCIHDFFAVFSPGDPDGNRQNAEAIVSGYGLNDILGKHIDAIIASAEHLYAQLEDRFPRTRTEREYPFRFLSGSGAIMRGDIDLLWFYNDDAGEHCLVVDYKSYAGFEMDEHTRKHYAQLSAYTDVLRSVGIDVTHAIVYYPVHGIAHLMT